MRRLLASLAVVALTVSFASAQDKAPDGDLKKLQGKWTATAGPDAATVTLILEEAGKDKGGKITFLVPAPNGEEMTLAGVFAIDETASPKAITWKEMKVKDRDLPDVQGIYMLEGADTLKIAGGNGTARPDKFVEKGKEGQGDRPNTMVFTRAKDKDDAKD